MAYIGLLLTGMDQSHDSQSRIRDVQCVGCVRSAWLQASSLVCVLNTLKVANNVVMHKHP